MLPQPKAVALPNCDPVTALSFHAAALANLARIARAGLSTQATVDRFLDLHPGVRLTTGNLDATCHALGIGRTQATRGGKVPNPYTARSRSRCLNARPGPLKRRHGRHSAKSGHCLANGQPQSHPPASSPGGGLFHAIAHRVKISTLFP